MKYNKFRYSARQLSYTMILTLLFLQTIKTQAFSQKVEFIEMSSWQSIVKRAAAEKKYILVDCYADWCLPCKKMDQTVFADAHTGVWTNDRFIAVRMNVDTLQKKAAKNITLKKQIRDFTIRYRVQSLPTLLFFTEQGQLVHKSVGELDKETFLAVCKDALNPAKQVFTRVRHFNVLMINPDSVSAFEQQLRDINEDKLADSLIKGPMTAYFNTLPDQQLLTHPYIGFLTGHFLLMSKSNRLFKFYQKNGPRIDSLFNRPLLTSHVIGDVIYKKDLEKSLSRSTRTTKAPNWRNFEKTLSQKYSPYYANFVLLDAKLKWYQQQQNWDSVIKYQIAVVERNGIDSSIMGQVYINNTVWNVLFKHATRNEDLDQGIQWMEKVLQLNPEITFFIDTYSNLLYKRGNHESAITWQNKAIQLDQKQAALEKRQINEKLSKTLTKMENGHPTWPQ